MQTTKNNRNKMIKKWELAVRQQKGKEYKSTIQQLIHNMILIHNRESKTIKINKRKDNNNKYNNIINNNNTHGIRDVIEQEWMDN